MLMPLTSFASTILVVLALFSFVRKQDVVQIEGFSLYVCFFLFIKALLIKYQKKIISINSI